MLKIMMLAKLWCEHTEGFESGSRAWELDVGEWERPSGSVLADAVKYTGTYANSAALRTALLRCCDSSRNLGGSSKTSGKNGTGADDDNRTPVDSLQKGKLEGQRQTPKPDRNSHKPHKQRRHQHLQELWWIGTRGERLLETRWRST